MVKSLQKEENIIPAGGMIQKLRSVWKTYGTTGLIRHLFRHRFPVHISLVFQKQLSSNACLVSGLDIQRFSSQSALNTEVIESIRKVGGNDKIHEVHKLFSRGCELWLGWMEGQIAGICWSWSHENKNDYFIPIQETDAGILSCFVFPAFRGRGIYPAMLETMVNTFLERDQIRNVYIDCKSWNTASVRGIQKAGFVSIGKAMRMVLFDKTWILWNQCKPLFS